MVYELAREDAPSAINPLANIENLSSDFLDVRVVINSFGNVDFFAKEVGGEQAILFGDETGFSIAERNGDAIPLGSTDNFVSIENANKLVLNDNDLVAFNGVNSGGLLNHSLFMGTAGLINLIYENGDQILATGLNFVNPRAPPNDTSVHPTTGVMETFKR